MEKINKVIDKYFDFMDEIGGMSNIDSMIPNCMVDHTKESELGSKLYWKAIKSTVSESEIQELEDYFNHKLPKSYKEFLQHRHFIELELGSYGVRFFKNLPRTFVEDMKEEIENYYWNLIERNYLPFAALSDYGVLCFDANVTKPNNEYPIITFDHEDEFIESDNYSPDFETMFQEFEENLDEWIDNKRKMNNN